MVVLKERKTLAGKSSDRVRWGELLFCLGRRKKKKGSHCVKTTQSIPVPCGFILSNWIRASICVQGGSTEPVNRGHADVGLWQTCQGACRSCWKLRLGRQGVTDSVWEGRGGDRFSTLYHSPVCHRKEGQQREGLLWWKKERSRKKSSASGVARGQPTVGCTKWWNS